MGILLLIMKSKVFIILCVLFFKTLFGQENILYSESNLIVKLKGNYRNHISFTKSHFNIPELNSLGVKFGLKEIVTLNKSNDKSILKLVFKGGNDIKEIAKKYNLTPYFEFVELDFIGQGGGQKTYFSFDPNDQYFGRQWSLNNNGTFSLSPSKIGADIQMTPSWELSQGSSDVIVAILDSGIKLDHSEFKNRIWENNDESNSTIDGDNNGYIGDIHGWDFANADNDPKDDHGHGTNVAGIVAANGNNLIGYAGIDWNCKIMPLKILDNSNNGFYSWWIEAIYYAVDNGANVINMSVGGISYSAAMEIAVNYAFSKNVSIVACMMNENNESSYYPAAYSSTIAVGSTNPDDSRSNSFPWNAAKGSNYGSHIDLSAPGNYIYGLAYNNNEVFGTYWSGTSQAAPHVTGVIALMLANNPNIDVSSIKDIIRTTAEDEVGRPEEDLPGWDKYHGAGRLNAFQALNALSTSIKEENKLENDYSIFPNPLNKNHELVIKFDHSSSRFLLIHDVNGRLFFTKKINDIKFNVDISLWVPGIYFINIIEDDIYLVPKKIIIYN